MFVCVETREVLPASLISVVPCALCVPFFFFILLIYSILFILSKNEFLKDVGKKAEFNRGKRREQRSLDFLPRITRILTNGTPVAAWFLIHGASHVA